jgi:hypothetical protein
MIILFHILISKFTDPDVLQTKHQIKPSKPKVDYQGMFGMVTQGTSWVPAKGSILAPRRNPDRKKLDCCVGSGAKCPNSFANLVCKPV